MKTVLLKTFFIGASVTFGQIKEERKVESFNQIKSSSALEVIVTINGNEGVVFEAEKDILPKLKAEVKKGELNLFISGEVKNSGKIIVYVSAKSIDGLSVSGASSMEFKNKVTCDKMKLEATGAGNIKLEINAKEINATAQSAGNIIISGTTKSLLAKVMGAGSIKAEQLTAETSDITASSAGNVTVNVTDNLNANASSAGNIIYVSEPKNKTTKMSSSGSIKKS